MSLLSFVKQRLQDLHHDANAVGHVVSRDVSAPVAHVINTVVRPQPAAAAPAPVAPRPIMPTPAPVPHVNPVAADFHHLINFGSRVVDQVNPLDNGRTFKQRTPTNNRSVVGQVTHNGATNVAGDTVKFIPQFALDYSNAAANLGRKAANATPVIRRGGIGRGGRQVAPLTPKQQFTDPLTRRAVQLTGATGTGKQLVGDAAQIALSTIPGAGKGASLLAKTAIGAGLGAGFGASGTYGAGGNLHDIEKSAAIGALEGGALPVAGKVVAKGGAAARDIATAKPHRNISDSELAAANRVSMQRSGFPDNTKPGDVETYRKVQQKLGVDPENHQAVDDAIGARMTYESRQAVRPKILSLASQGGGKGTQYNSPGKMPHENFEQEYADALKQMESGSKGGQMAPDGEGGYKRTTEHSQFYSNYYKEHGKAPTNAAWLEEAQRQLRSGKADPYAQREYNSLKSPDFQSLLASQQSATGNGTVGDTFPVQGEKPIAPPSADALRRSTAADRPTAINDALLAKKAKLDAAQAAQGTDNVIPETEVTPNAVHVEPAGKPTVSKFPERLLAEDRTAPLHPELEQMTPQPSLKNADVLAATGANIDRNEDQALAFAKRGNSTEANATALQLVDKYLREGQFEKAGDLVKTVNPRFRRQGQETQILAAYSKLTPAGAVRFAQHEVDKIANGSAKGKRLEDETNTTAKAVKQTANDVADQLDTEIKQGKLGTQKPAAGSAGEKGTSTGQSPEERLAARIKATEAKKTKGPDPVTDMVNTLHKVAKEALPADAQKSIPRDPMQLIGEAVKGEGDYRDVYDKAKAIVMDRYKDNPQAQAELEKYFTDDPKRTYAQSQVNAGVQSGLKGVDLGALVKQHYTAVDEVGKDLKTKLIERAGLSEVDAGNLASDIQKRYNELIQQRKDSIIKQIFGDKPTPKQTSAADKIFQYENLGALSKDELRPLVGEKLGVPSLSKEAIQEISDRANAIQQMPVGLERNRATAEMLRFIANQVPQNKVQGVLSIWKAGLLSGAKTQTGNLASNATFGALHQASNPLAAGLDAVLSKFTGQRTKTFTTRGLGSGTAEGVRKGLNTMRTGLDERNYTGDKFDVHSELNFKNPIIQNVFGKPSNFVFRGMSAADQPFYFAQAKNSLSDMALAEAKNRGLKGGEAEDFVKNMVANPTQEMAERAQHEAEQAVLSQESKIAASLTHLAQNHPTVQLVVPFIKVPTNFLTRTLDYTPVGAMKAAVKVMQDRRAGVGFDQRHFVQAVSEATTGSAILYLGAEMANNGLLSGAYPTDPKEQQRWKAQGITPNSIHIGNKWISLNYLGPLGLLLNAGKSYHDAAGAGNTGWTQALSSFGQNLAGQSFLSGFNSFANALQDPKRYANNLVNSEAGSVVPAWANDLANALDPNQRQAAGPGQTIQSRLPGVRNNLPVKTDVYGNDLPQRAGPASLTVDPTRPSKDLGGNNAVIQEVSRLHNVDPNNADLQVTPTPPTDINIEGKTVKLSAQQKYDLQNKVGQAVQSKWGQLIKTPEYQALSNVDKAKALSNLRSDVTTLAERQFVVDNNLGTYSKSPSAAVQALGQNEANLADYASKTQNSGASGVILNKNLDSGSRSFLTKYNAMSTKQRDSASYSQNDFDYKVAQAKYANDTANNSLSDAGKIKAQAALDKAKVGANYSRDVRDLYSLSNDELSQWLNTSDPGIDKQALAKQIIAYGDALASAGVVSKNKFRTSKGVLTLGESVTGGSRGKGRKAAKMKTVAIPGIKNNPYKSGGTKKQTFKQVKLPTIKSAVSHHSYKTPALKTNISAKLRKV